MPEAQSWDRVLQSPAYQALPRDAQLAAKTQYFHDVLAPKLGSDPQALGQAYTRFMDYRPIQLGQGETIKRTGEAGVREGAAGLLRTLGALVEYAGEHPSGEMGLPAEAYQPVYGAGDPLFRSADRQTDLARKARPQPGEKAPLLGQLAGGATGLLAAPFAAQQAATDQLRQGAGTGRAIAAAAAETPASAIQLAAPGLGGRLGGRFVNQPGLRRIGAKVLGGAAADVVAEPLATEVRNQGLPEAQRQPPQVTPEGIGQSAVFGLLARGAKPAAVPVPEGLPSLADIEAREGKPAHVEPSGLLPEEGEPEQVKARGLEEPGMQRQPDRVPISKAMQVDAQQHAAPVGGSPLTQAPLSLTHTPTTNTLSQIRSMPFPERWKAGEQYIQELHGSAGQQHFRVPDGGAIKGSGGRFVDAAVSKPQGGTLANEVKTYKQWATVNGVPTQRTVPLSDAIQQQVFKDAWLKSNLPGYDSWWHFLDAPPSPELDRALSDRGIPYVIYK